MSIGVHLDITNILDLDLLKAVGGDICQIIIVESSDLDTNKLKQVLKKNKMKILVHSNYTNNIAKNWDEYSPIIKSIIREIKIANILKAKYLVLHFGKSLDLELSTAYNNMYMLLLYILSKTKNITILLETPAGQGTETCVKLEELAYFYNKFNKEQKQRIKLCVDTCHIFAAGYDITSKEKIAEYLEKFDKLIGIKYIKLIHLNDSLNMLNSHLDRHAPLGTGYIGFKPLYYIYQIFHKLKVDVILETPEESYIQEIQKLT